MLNHVLVRSSFSDSIDSLSAYSELFTNCINTFCRRSYLSDNVFGKAVKSLSPTKIYAPNSSWREMLGINTVFSITEKIEIISAKQRAVMNKPAESLRGSAAVKKLFRGCSVSSKKLPATGFKLLHSFKELLLFFFCHIGCVR